jgi:hypothetical protein
VARPVEGSCQVDGLTRVCAHIIEEHAGAVAQVPLEGRREERQVRGVDVRALVGREDGVVGRLLDPVPRLGQLQRQSVPGMRGGDNYKGDAGAL